MKYRELGKTGIKVSEIALGCEGLSEENFGMCAKLFDVAADNGINYFDLYASNPELRAAIGEALKGRRDKFFIQSHIGSTWQKGQYKRSRKIAEVKSAFEDSLNLLQTDHIDVGMIHYCDDLKDWRQIVEGGTLDYARKLRSDGFIQHIGLSSHNPLVALEAVNSGAIEVLLFSVNPCYDLLPPDEDVEQLWQPQNYANQLVNMNPQRQLLYETCQRVGVGISVMKCFGGGDLLNAHLSPAGAALTVVQCLHYALTRPAVSTVCCGAHSVGQLRDSLAYELASDSDKDFASAFAAFPKISWHGHCMYCSHCDPCPKRIDIASVTKFLNLAKAQPSIPETVREHYSSLERHASDCIQCGLCEARCPFGVDVRSNMRLASSLFGF